MSHSIIQASINADQAIPYAEGSKLNCPALSCQLQASELTCLVGPDRAQLRSYLLMLAGISKPRDGQVEIMGQQLSELDQQAWQSFRTQIGYLSGMSPLLSSQHALMNVMLPILYHLGLSFHQTADKARSLLVELDCHFDAKMFPAQLSIFQRAQVALARALILQPKVLVLDLPFNDLGAKERCEMAELLGKYKQGRVMCMIGGLQYPQFLQKHADQIVFISGHKIISFAGWQSFVESDDSEVQRLLSFLQKV